MDIIQKTRDDYNKIASLYARTRNHPGELVQFKSFLKDGQHILDWGCGNAKLLYLLNDIDSEYYGLDQSKSLLKIAEKEHIDLVKKKKAKFFCTACKEKKFPEDFFDVAVLSASFHHLPDPKSRLKLLKKIYAETKPGGHLIITVWNLESAWAKAKLKKDWEKIGDNDYYVPWKDENGKVLVERYYHHFSKEELGDLVQKAGWKLEDLYYNTGVEKTLKKEGKNLVAIAVK